MRFKKRCWTVSTKRLVMNFDVLLREVRLGRVVKIVQAHGPAALLLPIGERARVAFKRRPRRYAMSNKPVRKW